MNLINWQISIRLLPPSSPRYIQHLRYSQTSATHLTTRLQHLRSRKTMANSSDNRPQAPSKDESQKPMWFPLGYKEAFSQWWAGLTPAQTEHTVLSYIPAIQKPLFQQPHQSNASNCSEKEKICDESAPALTQTTPETLNRYGPRKWHSNIVKLSGKDRALNEFSIEREGEEVENDLVMLHGYGAGLGFFYQNFEHLSRLPGWKLYALDLLGMGRSSRPSFRIHSKEKDGKIQEAENFFIDALEEWRIQKKIDRFTLMGHSLGGYMAVAYALKYPGHLKKLILVSPVGIPEDPYAVSAALPEPQSTTLQNEFTQPQEELTTSRTSHDSQQQQHPATTSSASTVPRRRIPKWASYLWDANVSPFSLVRLSGPLGPSLASGWTSRRFSHLPPAQATALHDYAYSIFRQPGSGEYALAYILAPGAFARSPLIRRIQGVGRQILSEPGAQMENKAETKAGEGVDAGAGAGADGQIGAEKREKGIPVVFMYGEHDWMDVKGGFAAESKINAEAKKMKDQGSAKVLIVPASGHHIYLDNPSDFNTVMETELKGVV